MPFSLETRIPECGTDKTNNPMSCQKVVSAMKENKALGVGKGRVERDSKRKLYSFLNITPDTPWKKIQNVWQSLAHEKLLLV